MQTVNYKGFVVTLSEADKKGLDKAWKGASKHWKCIVYDKPNRKQMGFDVYGGCKADMSPSAKKLSMSAESFAQYLIVFLDDVMFLIIGKTSG